MSGKIETWREMRQSAKRLLRRNGPMPWSAIEDVLYCTYGVEPDRDAIMEPEIDNNGVRIEGGKYVVVDD